MPNPEQQPYEHRQSALDAAPFTVDATGREAEIARLTQETLSLADSAFQGASMGRNVQPTPEIPPQVTEPHLLIGQWSADITRARTQAVNSGDTR